MFLDTWMLVVLVLTYGICAWLSSRSGFKQGSIATLISLEDDRIIRVHEDGSVSPYTVMPKKSRKKRKQIV